MIAACTRGHVNQTGCWIRIDEGRFIHSFLGLYLKEIKYLYWLSIDFLGEYIHICTRQNKSQYLI